MRTAAAAVVQVLALLAPLQLARAQSAWDQLAATVWQTRPVLSREAVPLPSSVPRNAALPPEVKSIYSPAVFLRDGVHYLVFGVAIHCFPNEEEVYKDSIAVATSTDGVSFFFWKYLLEPEPGVCVAGPSRWPDGTVYQVNDPVAWVEGTGPGAVVRILYTAAEWNRGFFPRGIGTPDCGHIGIAAFNANLDLLYRNDRFLAGYAECGALGLWPRNGYSRPDLRWISEQTSHLWFDASAYLRSTPLTAIDQLREPVVVDEMRCQEIGGLDIHLPHLDPVELILLQASYGEEGGIYGRRELPGGEWSFPVELTQRTTQPWPAPYASWDATYHGDPYVWLDTAACLPALYLTGYRREPSSGVYIGTIGLGTPAAGQVYSFPRCR